MEFMPPELLAKIFSFLDAISLVNCRQVCRRWSALTVKMVNPLYLPKIISEVMQELSSNSRLKDILKVRLVCKLWKEGLDQLTMHKKVTLIGLTNIESDHNIAHAMTHVWNPFPTRIAKLKLCFGHDNPDYDENQPENGDINVIIERFGMHVCFLQLKVQHADCTEKHLVKVLNYMLKTLQGLVVGESLSAHRFARKLEICEDGSSSKLGQLEKLTFLKLDDSECKLKYTNLYKRIIENAPNLQHLELNGYYTLDFEIIKLLAFRASGKMHLTHLKMDAEGSNVIETLKILNKSDLRLKYFSFKINGFGDAKTCDSCTSLLHSSLEKFSSSLERLELKLSWFEDSENLQPVILNNFPSSKYLTKLTRFKLAGYCGQLDFLKDLVLLTSLMIVDYKPESQRTFNSDQSFRHFLPKLKELYLLLQGAWYSADSTLKKKLQDFMYKGDASFAAKYCGLYQELFP